LLFDVLKNMRRIFRHILIIVPCVLAAHFAMMLWDMYRVETINPPICTLPISWLSGNGSKVSCGFGYTVTEFTQSVSLEPEVFPIRSYELRHWVFPLRVSYAGEAKNRAEQDVAPK